MARDGHGRFVRAEAAKDAEPEAEAEPEPETEGAGLAAGQAALLAAIAGRIEASERRQAEARREQFAASTSHTGSTIERYIRILVQYGTLWLLVET